MRSADLLRASVLVVLSSVTACGGPTSAPNPFLDDASEGKADTAYLNPDGIEVEVDLEGDVEADPDEIDEAPAAVGQFALTYLRENGMMYLESLAEDVSQRGRVEWLVDGAWLTAAETDGGRVAPEKLGHFRIRGMNAVLLDAAREGVEVGTSFLAPVPKRPGSLLADAQDSCARYDGHIALDQSVYWYLWEPTKASCQVERTSLRVTISKMFAAGPAVYPEYDRLMADKKLTVVVLFGQIGDGEIDDYDPGITGPARMATNLVGAGFQRVADAPLGERLVKRLSGGRSIEVDLYNARVFSGLGDYAHFENFQKALSEHEVVAYDGHSMLGASDFWARPTYPESYQIFLYGGCLGYEYYVRPIVEGKGGWGNVDILSSVIEVTADANQFAAPALNKLFRSVERSGKSSWRAILTAVRDSVGDSTFGVSGVRDNCYTPNGSRCPGS